MSKTLFVCVRCAQDFTREYGANRHNDNHHLARSLIVDFKEYIIGRIKGTIPPPTELPPRLIAIRKRKAKMAKNMPAHNKTKSPFTVYPDLTSENLNSRKDVRSSGAACSRPKKNDLLDETIAMFSEAVEIRNLQNWLSGNTSIPPAYGPEFNASSSTEFRGLTRHFSDFHSQTSESSFFGDILNNAKRLAILRCLVEKLRCDRPTFHNFSLPPPPDSRPHPVGTYIHAEGFPDQMSAPETIAQKSEEIFGFSGIACELCLSFEFVAHCFNYPERNGSVIPTKHTCKRASFQHLNNENGSNDRIHHIRQNMLISLAAATRTWTEDKITVRVLKIFTQADGQKNEILTIKHPSSPDKAVKIPLRSVNNIDLIIGRENHWVYRAIREQQTLLQRYELEDFLLRTHTSTFAIFRVKMHFQSGQQPVLLGTFFIYLSKHYDSDAT
jgi:hypothetical protein